MELYERSPAGYVTALADGTLARVNETFALWTGYSKEELIGRMRFQEILSFGARIYFETHIAPLLRMQDEVSEIAIDIHCRDGRDLPVLMSCVLRAPQRGAPLAYRMTLFNVSERRRYERELLAARRRAEDASRVKSDLLAMIGHDIRTPLSAIMNVARLLEETHPTPEQRALIAILQKSSGSLLDLINDILDYSKLEAGKLLLENRTFSIRSVVENLLASFSATAAEKGLALTMSIDEAVPHTLHGDPVKLSQVMMNLVANALKFTNAGGVDIGVKLIDAEGAHATLEIVVSDTGIGIEHDQLRHIFEEFTQANSDIGLKYGGTGLGLAISRKLLALFGSEMRVESTPGAGSRFAFTVKMHRTGDEPPAASGSGTSQGPPAR